MTSASGATTVPMSRPSATQSPRRRAAAAARRPSRYGRPGPRPRARRPQRPRACGSRRYVLAVEQYRSPSEIRTAAAISAGGTPRRSAASATPRYIAPESRYVNPSSRATARATLDFPAPAGPSIATTISPSAFGHPRQSPDTRPPPPPSRPPRRPPRTRARQRHRAARGGGPRRLEHAAPQPLPAAHGESITRCLDIGSEAAQAIDDGRDPVRFLDPQLAARHGRPPPPRRSSPAAPPAAARRSRAAPLRARPWSPRSGRCETSRSATGSTGRTTRAARCHRSRSPPSAQDPQKAGAGPVDADPLEHKPRPSTSTAAAIRNAAEERSPGTSIAPAPARRCRRRRSATAAPLSAARHSAPALSNIRSVWSRLGVRSITAVPVVAGPPAAHTT